MVSARYWIDTTEHPTDGKREQKSLNSSLLLHCPISPWGINTHPSNIAGPRVSCPPQADQILGSTCCTELAICKTRGTEHQILTYWDSFKSKLQIQESKHQNYMELNANEWQYSSDSFKPRREPRKETSSIHSRKHRTLDANQELYPWVSCRARNPFFHKLHRSKAYKRTNLLKLEKKRSKLARAGLESRKSSPPSLIIEDERKPAQRKLPIRVAALWRFFSVFAMKKKGWESTVVFGEGTLKAVSSSVALLIYESWPPKYY